MDKILKVLLSVEYQQWFASRDVEASLEDFNCAVLDDVTADSQQDWPSLVGVTYEGTIPSRGCQDTSNEVLHGEMTFTGDKVNQVWTWYCSRNTASDKAGMDYHFELDFHSTTMGNTAGL